ncbi:MAG: NTP transferase domain-containing protein [Bacteroidetes bacterium]|nr:NTP transferase domain-containing protein [Bacteroidota bacterium]
MIDQPRNGYILAGGKSSRMGTDKGLLMLKNKKIVEYVIDNFKPCVDQIFIVTSNDLYKQFDLPLVPDLLMGKGPAVGIFLRLNIPL